MTFIESMTNDELDQAIFVLECKDHWTEKDWAEYNELENKKRAFYPKPKEPTKEERDQETIKHYESLGMKFVGYNERGSMEFISTWE